MASKPPEYRRPTSDRAGRPEGTIVRGADGALYFIRDEVLEECRLPKDLVRQAEQLLREPERHEAEFTVPEPGREFEVVGRVGGNIGVMGQGFRANMAAVGTVMCPSFLFSRTNVPERVSHPGRPRNE